MFVILGIFYLILGLLEIFEKTFSKKCIAFFSLFPAFLLTAFRDANVGCDTPAYLYDYNKVFFFNSLIEAVKNIRFESGYVIIEYLFSHTNLSFFHMQFCISLFFYTSLFFFLTKYSENIGISCFLFLTLRYLFASMVVTRMYIALAILWFSIPFILNRNFWRFTFVVLIASSFHKTAFIFILLYPISLIKLSKKNVALFLLTASILELLGKSFFLFLSTTLGLYESYLDGVYLNFSGNIAVYLVFLIDICLALFVLYNRDEENYQIQNTQEIISIQKLSLSAILLIICCDIIGFNFSLMSRISGFFCFCWLIMIPFAFMRIKNKIVAIVSLILVALCLLAQFETVNELRPNWNCIEPYHFYFGDIF